MPESRRKVPGLTGTQLKAIAMVSMAVDHGAVVLAAPMVTGRDSGWYVCYWLMRSLGRVAFPLFAFLLAEGAYYTGNRWGYLKRLCLFAVISEIPFDLAVGQTAFSPGAQNVFFTLAIALLVIMGMERAEGRRWLQALAAVCGCVAAEALRSDYGMWGVLLVLVYWRFRNRDDYRRMGEIAIFFVLMPGIWGLSYFLVIPLTESYHGRQGRRLGIWAYGFYPVHLAVLTAIRYLIFR